MKAFRNAMLSLATLVLVAAVPAAYAATLDVYGSPNPTTTTAVSLSPIMGTIDVAQFDSSLGTLNSVEVIMSGTGSSDYFVSYTGTGTAEVDDFHTTAHLYMDALSIPTLDLTLAGTDTLGPLYLTNGGTFDSGYMPIIGSNVSEFVALAGWTGLGVVTFDLTGKASSGYDGTIPSGGSLTLTPTTQGSGSVEVIYDYTPPGPVPEPGTLTMFGTGLLGLAGMLRYKFLHSR